MDDLEPPTVLMATFNGAAFLQSQLESIAHQTLLPGRLMVSDDGSTDDTLAILRRFQMHAPFPVEIYSGPRQNVTANFLSLLRNAPDGAVAFCDQDDVWMPQKLRRAFDQLRNLPPGPALWSGARSVTDQNLHLQRRAAPTPQRIDFAGALVQNLAPGNTTVLNRDGARLVKSALARLSLDPAFHDWWVYQLVLGANGAIIFDPVPSLLYRQHGDNILGACFGLSRRYTRLRLVLNGTYGHWLHLQTNALWQVADLLTPHNANELALFRYSLTARNHGFAKGRFSRQGRHENALLWLAARMGKI